MVANCSGVGICCKTDTTLPSPDVAQDKIPVHHSEESVLAKLGSNFRFVVEQPFAERVDAEKAIGFQRINFYLPSL